MSVADEITRLQTAKADIKTAIEEKGVMVGDGTIDTYAEKINEIQGGGGGSFDEGYEEGIKAQYDAFWDAFQDNGNETNYAYAFGGAGWTPETFKPKYDILIVGNGAATFKGSKIGNLKQILNNLGKKLDLSQCTNFTETFGQPGITHIGVVDTRSASSITSAFVWNSDLREIEKLILKDDGSQTSSNAFVGTSKLETLFIEGVIGNDFRVQSNVLNRASIESIVNHLSDEKGATLTLKKLAVTNAFGSVDAPEWIELITPKSNQYNGKWTISLE